MFIFTLKLNDTDTISSKFPYFSLHSFRQKKNTRENEK